MYSRHGQPSRSVADFKPGAVKLLTTLLLAYKRPSQSVTVGLAFQHPISSMPTQATCPTNDLQHCKMLGGLLLRSPTYHCPAAAVKVPQVPNILERQGGTGPTTQQDDLMCLANRFRGAAACSLDGFCAGSSPTMVCNVQVNGAVGCLARIPLPSRAFRAPHIPLPWLSHKQADGDEGASDGGPGASADSSSEHGRFAKELWEPYLQDTSLRVFASCGLSGQVCFGVSGDQHHGPSAPSIWAGTFLVILCCSDDVLSSAQALHACCGHCCWDHTRRVREI